MDQFFGPARSPWFYIQPLTDNVDSVNEDFRLTQTTFSTHCHQNTSVNTDCVAVWTPELRPVGRQLFTDGSYYNGTSGYPAGEMRCRLTSLCLPAVHVNPIRWEVAVAIDCWLFSLWIVGLCTCTSCIQANVHLNNTRIETNLLKTTLPFFSTFWITRTLVNTDVFGQSTEVRVNEVLLYNFKAPFLGTGNIIVLSDCIVILRI